MGRPTYAYWLSYQNTTLFSFYATVSISYLNNFLCVTKQRFATWFIKGVIDAEVVKQESGLCSYAIINSPAGYPTAIT